MEKNTETDIGSSLREVTKRALPTLDVGPALTGDIKAIKELSEKWRDVWQNLGFMCITNHGISDELIFEIQKSKIEKFSKLIINEMQNALEPHTKLSIPLIVDSNSGKNWNEER